MPEMPVKQNAPAEDSDQAHKVNGYQKRINETVAHPAASLRGGVRGPPPATRSPRPACANPPGPRGRRGRGDEPPPVVPSMHPPVLVRFRHPGGHHRTAAANGAHRASSG